MDLVAGVRKEGSRGGRDSFKWSDVKDSQHRENYLGHSLMAPVGRWQKNKDLSWYAKGDEAGKTAEELARAEEIRLIKEAEQDALSAALGFPVEPRIRDSQVAGEKDVERAMKEAEVGEGEDQAVGGGKGLGYGGFSGSGPGADEGERLGGVHGGAGGIINRKQKRPKARMLPTEVERRDRERRYRDRAERHAARDARHRDRDDRHRRHRARDDERATDRPRRHERRRSPSSRSSSTDSREHRRKHRRARTDHRDDEREPRRRRDPPDSKYRVSPARDGDRRDLAAAGRMSPASRPRAEGEFARREEYRKRYATQRSRSRGSPGLEAEPNRRGGSGERHLNRVWDREVEGERDRLAAEATRLAGGRGEEGSGERMRERSGERWQKEWERGGERERRGGGREGYRGKAGRRWS